MLATPIMMSKAMTAFMIFMKNCILLDPNLIAATPENIMIALIANIMTANKGYIFSFVTLP
jgi:hypothetical protein